jgi:tetratricopeptide (TPR) repeat protein
VAKRKLLEQLRAVATSQPSSLERLMAQLQALIQQRNYRQALDKVKQIQKLDPAATLTPSEAEIWSLRGQQEYAQGQYRQAETSFRQAIALGPGGEAYYWVAKSLLAQDELDAALDWVRTAFEQKVLPKDCAGCYLKLLFLKGESAKVAELLTTQSKQFYAPQLHWARGVLALQAEQPQEAITHFKKMGRKTSPGDFPHAWMVYAYQQQGNWDTSEAMLGMRQFPEYDRMGLSASLPKHPAIQRLAMVQAVIQQRSLSKIISPTQPGPQQTLVLVLELLHLLETSNHHDAAHVLQTLDHPCPDFPEVDQLFRPVMILAAEQAVREGELDCTAAFLEAIVYQPPFDAQIAIKLYQLYGTDDYPIQSIQRLLNHLIEGVKQEAREHPEAWPESRLNAALAQIHCWLTDAWMGRGQQKQGYKALQTAEKLCPDSPEVMGRQGMKASMQGQFEQATQLMTKALEGGCQFVEVYRFLLKDLERRGNLNAVKDIRRRFGPKFGDLNVDTEVDIPRWVEALSTQDYWMFEGLVDTQQEKDAALKACQLFVAAVEGDPTASGRVSLNQAQVVKSWDRLLLTLPPVEQIQVFQAIFLTIQLFVKRQKGIAALQTQYLKRLFALTDQFPEAKEIYLALLVVKDEPLSKWQAMLQEYLSSSPQPDTALAQVQLKARRYGQSALLRPLLDEALRRETQNPQLLLAKATTFTSESQHYKTLQKEGFELARRLQDAQALQAYREEEALQAERMTAELMPDLTNFRNTGTLDPMDMLRKMAQKMFGNEVPPKVLEQMLPELMRMLESEMPDLDDEEDDFFDTSDFFGRGSSGSGFPFGPPPSRAKRQAKQKVPKFRRGF